MKLTKFEAELVVNGIECQATYDGDTLTLENIDVADVMALLQHVGKFKAAGAGAPAPKKKERKLRADAGKPKAAKPAIAANGHSDRLDKPPADPFVEDSEETKLKDEAARIQHAVEGEECPPELLQARDLRAVLLYLSEKRGITDHGALVEACERWKTIVPVLQRCPDIRARVEGTATVLQIGA